MPCPDDQILVQLLGGLLDGGKERALEDHIDRCHDCQRLMEALARAGARDSRASSASSPPERHAIAERDDGGRRARWLCYSASLITRKSLAPKNQ